MECELIELEMTPFYFGAVNSERREACENHIQSCGDCLKAFLQLKRYIEEKPEPFELPGTKVQTNIRQRISEQMGIKKGYPIYSFRNRLFQGVAVAASIAAIWIGVIGYKHGNLFEMAKVGEGQIRTEIDTASDTAVSLNVL